MKNEAPRSVLTGNIGGLTGLSSHAVTIKLGRDICICTCYGAIVQVQHIFVLGFSKLQVNAEGLNPQPSLPIHVSKDVRVFSKLFCPVALQLGT
jgi:hypothetical protein